MSKHCLNVILYSNAESLMAAILSLAAAGKHETRQKKRENIFFPILKILIFATKMQQDCPNFIFVCFPSGGTLFPKWRKKASCFLSLFSYFLVFFYKVSPQFTERGIFSYLAMILELHVKDQLRGVDRLQFCPFNFGI